MTQILSIRGNSASGKTSLAKAIRNNYKGQVLLIPQDSLRRDILGAKDGPDTPTISLIKHLLEYGFKKKFNLIILEGILRSDWYQPVFDYCQTLSETNILAYYYALPFEETLKRHQTRDKAKEFGEESLKRWWLENDLALSLKEKILTEDLSLEDTVQVILSDLGQANQN